MKQECAQENEEFMQNYSSKKKCNYNHQRKL